MFFSDILQAIAAAISPSQSHWWQGSGVAVNPKYQTFWLCHGIKVEQG
jgi:hypothetical protein